MRIRAKLLRSLGLPLLAVSLCPSCSSIIDSSTQKRAYVQAYMAGDFVNAAKMSEDKAESRGDSGDGLMWYLEAGKSAFANGDYRKSLAFFEAAEAKIDEFDKRAVESARDVASESASAVTNPNAIPYRGSYMDREMLNSYKALCYFALGKPEDACVEIRRMHERQKLATDGREAELKATDELANKSKINADAIAAGSPELKQYNATVDSHIYKSYANLMNPFCSYLSYLGYLWQGNLNEALVDLRNLRTMDPNNGMLERDYVTIARLTGEQLPPELAKIPSYPYPLTQNVVFLIAENGMVPSRQAVTIHMFLPPPVGYAGIAFPKLAFTPPALGRVDWSTNGGPAGQTFRVSDMNAVAAYEYKDSMKAMIVRIVIGTLIKEGGTVVAYEAVKHNVSKQDQGLAYLVLAVAGLWKYTFNTADTRSWQTLPGEFQAASLPMPKDGVLRLGVDGGPVKCVYQLDPTKKMTIVYVQSPLNGVFSIKVFQFD